MATTLGRPRRFDESAVLDRAVELFWRRGYRDSTTRELETALGISQSSLYNAFGSKQGLMTAALDRYEERTSAALLAPLETGTNPLDDIDRFFDDLAVWVTGEGRGGCMIINLMAEDGGADQATSTRTAAYRTRVREALRGALQRAAANGTTSLDHLDQRTSLLFGEVLGMNILARAGASRGEVVALAAGVHHLVATWRT